MMSHNVYFATLNTSMQIDTYSCHAGDLFYILRTIVFISPRALCDNYIFDSFLCASQTCVVNITTLYSYPHFMS